MRVAILGYGVEGRSALEYWRKGNDITICDSNPGADLPAGVDRQLGDNYLANLDRFNLIIRSPSVHPKEIVAANSERILSKVTSVTEEFFRVCPVPVVAITGTKGKGTTTVLIAELLKAYGQRVLVGGNIGVAALDLLRQDMRQIDWVVLEISNFQLIDSRVSPRIAVCVMIAPEHLNWHTDMREYIDAKKNLFKYQGNDDRAVFNRLNDYSAEIVGVSPAFKVSYEVPPLGTNPTEKSGVYVMGDQIYVDDEPVFAVSDIALLGRHNLENVCAALAAVWKVIDGDPIAIRQALTTFKGLPHRLEFVRELDGVTFIDDSFGTTPESTIVALQTFDQPKVLILGGSDKGVEFDDLAKSVVDFNMRGIVVIGQTANKIKAALTAAGYKEPIVDGGDSIANIVSAARHLAQPGDVVLLSTACASFGLFKNYKDRGEQFAATVKAL